MNDDWTIRRMLAWMTQDFAALAIASPRLDAELLLSHALGCDRVRLYMDMQRPLSASECDAIRALVVRRRQREPVAYILGHKEFYRRSFEVTSQVLVPRPETEILVDRSLECLPAHAERALDLCTGSGAIGLTLALERPLLRVDASDASEAALAVARRNAIHLGVEQRVALHAGDLFAALPQPQRYDLVVSNPPYVADSEWDALAPEITRHEPRLALLAGVDGLAVLRRICSGAAAWLLPGGVLSLEVGRGQAAQVTAWLSASADFEAVESYKDLAGIDRVVAARRRP